MLQQLVALISVAEADREDDVDAELDGEDGAAWRSWRRRSGPNIVAGRAMLDRGQTSRVGCDRQREVRGR